MREIEITPTTPRGTLEDYRDEIAAELTEYHSDERRAEMKKKLAYVAFEISQRDAA